jgi:hypothetical protein
MESGLRLFCERVAGSLYDGGFRPPMVWLLDGWGWDECVVRTPLVWNAPAITVWKSQYMYGSDFDGGGFLKYLNLIKMKNIF